MKNRLVSFSLLSLLITCLILTMPACETNNYTEGLSYTEKTVDGICGYEVSGIGYSNDIEIIIPSKVDGKAVISIGDHAFSNRKDIISVSLPNSLKEISDWAFVGCERLEKILLPTSLTTIGSAAFKDCINLTEIVIPYNVSTIGSSAFWGCKNIKQASMYESNAQISDYMFYGCLTLESVILSDSIIKIGDNAFYNCISLQNVFYKGTEVSWEQVNIRQNNLNIRNATIYFYSENKPSNVGNYWHFADGQSAVWE